MRTSVSGGGDECCAGSGCGDGGNTWRRGWSSSQTGLAADPVDSNPELLVSSIGEATPLGRGTGSSGGMESPTLSVVVQSEGGFRSGKVPGMDMGVKTGTGSSV
jgi:hypothetical protein